jgi:glycerol uptake facilitator-like aquaporin
MDKSLRTFVAEMIGTFCLVFLSAAIVCANAFAAIHWPATALAPGSVTVVQPEPGLIGIALATGLAYASLLAVTLLYSDGYLNPVIPLSLWVLKRFDMVKAAGMIGAQCLGAVAAGGVVRLLFGFREDIMMAARLGTPHFNVRMFERDSLTPTMLLEGIGIELALTFIFTFVLFAVHIDRRLAERLGPRAWSCVWVGSVLAACTLAGFSFTGAALNPARWLGTVVWESTVPALAAARPYQDHVLYWFGPSTGALIAALLYSALILPEEEVKTTDAAAHHR